jgi:hypothetical protein
MFDRRAHHVRGLLVGLFGLALVACGGASHESDAGEPRDPAIAPAAAIGPDAAIAPGAGPEADAATAPDAGPEPECSVPADCPAPSSGCGVATCEDGSCGVAPAAAGTECRAAAGLCDVPETCDGTSLTCPEDGFASAGTECRAAAGLCDVPETCDGASAACPDDALAAAGTECRAAAGLCDVPETCDGASAACPDDALAAAGTECRAAETSCDAAEVCDGGKPACPAADEPAALCTAVTPITYSALGRHLTFDTVDLNGTGSTVATVSPGATVTLRLVGGWIDTDSTCGSCSTQFYARMNGVFSLCLGSTSGNRSFDLSTSFTAPSTPGVYIVNPRTSWLYGCDGSTHVSTSFGPSSIATLIVE